VDRLSDGGAIFIQITMVKNEFAGLFNCDFVVSLDEIRLYMDE
jgi:hypothetical protein